MSDTSDVIAAYVAELEAKRLELRLQTEATEHSERENVRLSGLLKEARRQVVDSQAQVERLEARIQAQGGE